LIQKIQTGELHIWRYTVNEQDYIAEQTKPMLSVEETKKSKRFIREEHTVDYVCNHRFVRNVLAAYLNILPSEIKFNVTPLGKPYIENSNLFFNVSHSKNKALLAISIDAEVGVDIEYMKDLQDAITFSNYSFSDEEKAMIFKDEEINKDVLFTFWTFKEAYIKATGTGLSVDISIINLSDFYANEVHKFGNETWTLKRLQTKEGFKAAFAIAGEIDTFIEFKYDEFFK
jgi:4'-phosphopantetheinyl transferase